MVLGLVCGGAPDEPWPVVVIVPSAAGDPWLSFCSVVSYDEEPSYLAVVQRSGVGLCVYLAGSWRDHAARW